MRLLKIGTLNIPAARWVDALTVFDKITVVCFSKEKKLQVEGINYKCLEFNRLSAYVYKKLQSCAIRSRLDFLSKILIELLRLLNHRFIKSIDIDNYDVIHSSYNDFDESALLTLLLRLTNNYTRAQKETRLHYSYLEKMAFLNASRIVLNDIENKKLYESKYGDIFKNKELVIGLDEDVRSQELKNKIDYLEKKSKYDGRIHAVILAGRVLSNPNDGRSGGRLYYMYLIEKLLHMNFVVHLHTGLIVPYEGSNPYEVLAKNNNDFIIENKLDFDNDPIGAYKILSQYDIGILHAHIPNSEVTLFDKVNIPHRYYEYELAHVVPIDKRRENYLIDKKADLGYALTYDELSEISLSSLEEIVWDIPSFREYIEHLYK